MYKEKFTSRETKSKQDEFNKTKDQYLTRLYNAKWLPSGEEYKSEKLSKCYYTEITLEDCKNFDNFFKGDSNVNLNKVTITKQAMGTPIYKGSPTAKKEPVLSSSPKSPPEEYWKSHLQKDHYTILSKEDKTTYYLEITPKYMDGINFINELLKKPKSNKLNSTDHETLEKAQSLLTQELKQKFGLTKGISLRK